MGIKMSAVNIESDYSALYQLNESQLKFTFFFNTFFIATPSLI